jgi:iron complex outermembrane receptor protein
MNVRGFYGGGEAEYMLVLVDGRSQNDFESDLINWNTLPISSIQSMEILKGQSSSFYGNIVLGGVLNIRTKKGKIIKYKIWIDGNWKKVRYFIEVIF